MLIFRCSWLVVVVAPVWYYCSGVAIVLASVNVVQAQAKSTTAVDTNSRPSPDEESCGFPTQDMNTANNQLKSSRKFKQDNEELPKGLPKDSLSIDENKAVLYVNIRVYDGSELVDAIVKHKVEGAKLLPKPIQKIASDGAAKAANKLVPTSKIAKIMGEKLCEILPRVMKDHGLTVAIEEVFREGTYVVLELQIQYVDIGAVEKIIKKRQEKKKMDSEDNGGAVSVNSVAGAVLDWSLWVIGKNNLRSLEEDFLPQKVQEKLKTQMMTILEENFEKRMLETDVQILPEESQARYFYAKLKEIHATT